MQARLKIASEPHTKALIFGVAVELEILKRDSSFRDFGRAPSTAKHFQSKVLNKSGNTPKTLSEQILNFQVWIPKPWKIKHIPSVPRRVSKLCDPQHGSYRFFLCRGPSMKQSELVMKFLTILGALLKIENFMTSAPGRLSCAAS